jgi:hypothetical protein
MRICSKCKIEKEVSEFYTYYHSKYDKHFTRRTCTSCYIKQQLDKRKEHKDRLKEERKDMIEVLIQQNIVEPVVSELIVEDFSTNPDYRKCVMCENYKVISEFYQNKQSGYYHTRCKICHNEYTNKRQHEYYQKKYETCGGSERVIPKPNMYMDKYQEEQTRWLMELLGWNKDGDVWVKENVKRVVDGKIVWDILPKKVIKLRKTRTVITEDDIKHIIELRNKGLLMREIALIYKCSKTLIGKILIKHNEEAR